MADQNQIRIESTMTAIAVLDETVGSTQYEALVVDQNIDSVGGHINWGGASGYEGGSAYKWENKPVAVSSATALSDNTWCGVAGTGSAIPVKIRALAIRYNSKVGTPGKVVISIDSGLADISILSLDVGEGCSIPLNGSDGVGFGNADIKIHQISRTATDYGNVTLALLGHDGV